MKSCFKTMLLSGVAASLSVTALHAQTAGSDGDTAGQAASPANANDDLPDGEIIVTATRQDQRISKVPISISAYSQDSMDKAGVRGIADVARLTPGVTLNSENNFIAIRGISSIVGAGTTGIYIDDTPIQVRGGGAGMQNSALVAFDLDRIEILRGPQGTLFGAGSEGGTLRYITPQPSLKAFRVYGRAEGSATDGGGANYEAGLGVGGPIIEDKIGFRISAYHRYDSGYIDLVDRLNGARVDKNINSRKATSFQAAVTLAPIEDIQITPSIYYQKRQENAPDTLWAGFSDLKSGRMQAAWNVPVSGTDRFILPALKIQMSLSDVDLISNTSYYDRRQSNTRDYSSYTAGIFGVTTPTGPAFPGVPDLQETDRATTTQKNWTQEVRLQSSDPSSRFTYVFGLFYSHAKQYNQELVRNKYIAAYIDGLFPGATPTDIFGAPVIGDIGLDARLTTIDSQLAFFGDVTYALTDKLKLTLGGRYSRTKFSFQNDQYGPYNGGVTTGNGTSKQNPFTPKVNIQYQADTNNLFYATASKGFRIGGANNPVSSTCNDELAGLGLSQVPQTYDGDSVWSYELGAKNRLFGGKLQLASSVYQIDWKSIQQPIILASCGYGYIANTGNARSRGFDIQAQLNIARGLNLSGTLGYNNIKFTKDVVNAGTLLSGNPADVNYIVRKGDKVEIPPWTASVAVDYSFDALGYPAYFRGDYQYSAAVSRNVTSLNPTAGSYDPDFTPLRMSNYTILRIGAKFGPADLSLFVNNVLNSHAELTRSHTQVGNQVYYLTTFRPRTVGLTLVYRH